MITQDWYFIWSHEHEAWWKPGGNGYTRHWQQAGLFTLEGAKEICLQANRYSDRVMEEMVSVKEGPTFAALKL